MISLQDQLLQKGFEIVTTLATGHPAVGVRNRSLQPVSLIMEKARRRSVAMFDTDVEDLAASGVTLEQIERRNIGADLADPWPAVDEEWMRYLAEGVKGPKQ